MVAHRRIFLSNIGLLFCFIAMAAATAVALPVADLNQNVFLSTMMMLPAIGHFIEISEFPGRLTNLLTIAVYTSPVFLVSALLRLDYDAWSLLSRRKKIISVVVLGALLLMVLLLLSITSYGDRAYGRLGLYVRCVSGSSLCLSVLGPLTIMSLQYILFAFSALSAMSVATALEIITSIVAGERNA